MRAVRAVIWCWGVAGALTTAAAQHPLPTPVTYTGEIRAILQARCAGCHGAGGSAPMPLTTYEEVQPWARAIKAQVLTRKMPTWHAARGYGAFANDPSLTPLEMALIAAWSDGGAPEGASGSRAPAASRGPGRSGMQALGIPASGSEATVRIAARWIAGWWFEPGDRSITSATFTSVDGTRIGTWVAGDAPVQLPTGGALRVRSPIRVALQRRKIAGDERPGPAKPSTLWLAPRAAAPARRVWVEQAACGAPRTGAADLLAVRPLLGDGGAARVWLERPGAPRTIVGWFRDYDTRYPRTYWLARAAALLPESRVQADVPCTIELTLVSR